MQVQLNSQANQQNKNKAANKMTTKKSMDKFFGRFGHSETSSRGYRNMPRSNYATLARVA